MSDLAVASLDWVQLLVDQSASMDTILNATVRGMDNFVRKTQGDQQVNLSVVAFDTDEYGGLRLQTLLDTTIAGTSTGIVPSMYRPDGDTPLLAAVWETISHLESKARKQDRVLLAIMTDGIENASGPKYRIEKLRTRIKHKLAEGWRIVYLGAEIDAWKTGQHYGVGTLNALSWSPTQQGVEGIFQTLADSTNRWTKNKALTAGKAPERFFPLQLPPPKGKP